MFWPVSVRSARYVKLHMGSCLSAHPAKRCTRARARCTLHINCFYCPHLLTCGCCCVRTTCPRSMKHKQELGSLRAELQKLQLESKTGQKGKDLATKELEGLKWVMV